MAILISAIAHSGGECAPLSEREIERKGKFNFKAETENQLVNRILKSCFQF
jgi:hypothetical protein